MTLTISTTNNQYSLRVPSHRFRQGGRDVYYFALDLATLDGILPQRVDDSVVSDRRSDVNRRLTPSHAKDIQSYLNEKEDWVLGALLLGIARDAVEFKPYSSQQEANFGELRIRTNRASTMRIFDGQHRRRAIREVLAELSNAHDDRARAKLDKLRTASMSIVLYVEDDIKTLRQMFVDASKTKPIEGNTVTRFDQRDAFNQVAVRLAEESKLFKDRVEMERASVARTNPNLLAINQLATVLKSLEVGYGRRVSRDRNDLYLQELDELYRRCLVWSDEFMPAAREEYSEILSGHIASSEIPRLRTATFAYSVTFIRVLAISYARWMKMNENDSWMPLADFIRKASINYGSDHGLLVDAGLTHPDGAALFSRRQELVGAVDYIVRAVKATL